MRSPAHAFLWLRIQINPACFFESQRSFIKKQELATPDATAHSPGDTPALAMISSKKCDF